MCLSVEICCFCASLEIGAKVVAVMNVVLSVLIAAVYGFVAATLSYLPSSRRTFYALVSAAALGQLVLCCLMTHGAFRRKPRFLRPWAATAWAMSVVLTALAIMGTVLLTFDMDNAVSSEISTMISVYFIYAVTLYYSASVVNSRRLEMLREIENEASIQLMRQKHVPKSLIAYEDVV